MANRRGTSKVDYKAKPWMSRSPLAASSRPTPWRNGCRQSDQLRAATTAQIIAAAFGVEAHVDVRLREQSLGELEGTLSSQLRAEPTPPGHHISEIAWGGGESLQQVHKRCMAFLADVDAEPTIIVSHGDTLRVMLAVLAGRSHRDVDWVPIGNTDVLHRSHRP
ncbi:N(G),N(G)-dimethylarginine dimethylaminohydrolase 2 [Platysternon megacephalum]|uniref:N(G),N(G)-dimethylarginine dimethylaminohydrolase 2 n=1 Tax=Platysternon megacephalum TaxID=55544 RepID=A0A4D9DJ35_9SAUR|nr:N(G),N(G)-dimethylarginine dimethylaminohydrolase 2 [Platysternon megacephalum]